MRFRNSLEQKNDRSVESRSEQNSRKLVQRHELSADKREEYSLIAQETICSFFVSKIRKESPDWILQQFDNLFISQTGTAPSEIHHALYAIISLNQGNIFRKTLKRCCYILVNNWSTPPFYQYLEKLIQLLSQVPEKQTQSPTKERLRQWLKFSSLVKTIKNLVYSLPDITLFTKLIGVIAMHLTC